MRVNLLVAFLLALLVGAVPADASLPSLPLSLPSSKLAASASSWPGLASTSAPSLRPLTSVLAPISRMSTSFRNTIYSSRRHLIAAAAARAVSISAMYPVDTIKTRLQLNQPFTLQGLHRGLGASLAGQVPYGVLTFGGYAVYKEQLRALFPKSSNLSIFTAAAVLGDLTGSAWLCPSEVVKQQLQGGLYPNSKAALAAILRKDGISGLYRGYAGNVARDVPFRVAQMLSYELCKAAVLFRRSRRSELALPDAGSASAPALALTSGEAALCGAAAGSFAAAITCPLDKVKTLLMTGKYTGSYAGCVRHIVDTQGVKGLWGGLLPRVALIGPSVAIFFLVYEKVEQLVGKKPV